MPSWYDLPNFDDFSNGKYNSRLEIEAPGIEEAAATYEMYVKDPRRTIFAGFSQGAAVALYAGLRWNGDSGNVANQKQLKGILGMSGYLPNARNVPSVKKAGAAEFSVLLCHGDSDAMVQKSQAELTFAELRDKHCEDVELQWYPMGHEACREEIDAVAGWLRAQFPEEGALSDSSGSA